MNVEVAGGAVSGAVDFCFLVGEAGVGDAEGVVFHVFFGGGFFSGGIFRIQRLSNSLVR